METTRLPKLKRPIKQCENCNVEKSDFIRLYKCARCLCAYYCSTECQRDNYKQHRPQCKGSESFAP